MNIHFMIKHQIWFVDADDLYLYAYFHHSNHCLLFLIEQLANIKEQTISSILCQTLEDDRDLLRKPKTTLRMQKFATLQTRDFAVRHLV